MPVSLRRRVDTVPGLAGSSGQDENVLLMYYDGWVLVWV